MTIPTKLISGFVSDMIATWSAQTGTSTSFSDGDPLLAFWQSVSAQLDFLQAQIQLVLALARAQTSTGADLDSWMAQFNFVRLPADFATGPESFRKLVPAATAILVPVGAIVQTVGGAIQYEVVADTNNSAYNAAADGYVLAIGQTAITATVEALVGGSGSNLLANQLIQFGSSVPGIDQVTNPAPITNGLDAESDPSFRSRFILYLATLAKATKAAILAAAMSVQQGLLIALLENQQPDGTVLLGSFTVIADDGSGSPPASLLNAIFNAVDAVRAFSVQPFVVPPTSLQAVIALAVNLAPIPGIVPANVNTAVQNAIAAMTNQLPPGARLNGSAIITAALSVFGVVAVNPSSVTINGISADLIPSIQQEIRTSVIAITVDNY